MMAIMATNVDQLLVLADCARLLGREKAQLERLHREGRFAAEAGPGTWSEHAVLEWAAKQGGRWARCAPLRYWPDAQAPASLLRVCSVEGAVVQRWQAEPGVVAVVWNGDPMRRASADLVRAAVPEAAALVRVDHDFGHDGPALSTVLPDGDEDWEGLGARWTDLARVLGQAPPYWPSNLRRAELIEAWRPGAAPVTAMARSTSINTAILLVTASTVADGSAVQRVLVHLAREVHHRAAIGTDTQLQTLARHTARARVADPVVVAARPLEVPEPGEDGLDEPARRAAWQELLDRDDELALACVHEVGKFDGGADFPYGAVTWVSPASSPWAAEWAQRLQPAEWTVAHRRLARDAERAVPLRDPVTGVPAVRDRGGEVAVVAPVQLPGAAPVAQVALEGPVWIRTADKRVYPAPQRVGCGFGWGYDGTGPATLALLLQRLLDEVTAPALHITDLDDTIPRGLEKVLIDAADGQVLDRAEMQAALRED